MDLIVIPNQNKNVEEATIALDSKVRQYSEVLAESYYLQNVRGKNNNFFNFESYITKAHSGLLSFLKSQSFTQDDPNILLRGLYQGQVPNNTPFKPTTTNTTTTTTNIISNFNNNNTNNNINNNKNNNNVLQQQLPTNNLSTSILATTRPPDNNNKLQFQQQQQLQHQSQFSSNINHNSSSSSSINNSNKSQQQIIADGSISYHHHHQQQLHSQQQQQLQQQQNKIIMGGPVSVVGGTGSCSSSSNIDNKKFSEKMKAEASVVQRISELQKEGMWYDKRLPRAHEASRNKTHWDYLLEEMAWLAADFASERKWKRIASKRCAKMIEKHFNDKEAERIRAEKEEEIKVRRLASFIAKEVNNFWSNVQKLVEYKEQSRIDEIKKQALDQQLSYIVDQTEKYSSMLAESFITDNNSSIMDDSTRLDDSSTIEPSHKSSNGILAESSLSDDEFEPDMESGEDDEETIAKAEEDAKDVNTEIEELQRESQMSLDDFLDELPADYIQDWKTRFNVVDEPTSTTTTTNTTATNTITTSNDTLENQSALPPDKEDEETTAVSGREDQEKLKENKTSTSSKTISEKEDTSKTASTPDEDGRRKKILNEALDVAMTGDSAAESESEQGTDIDNEDEGEEEDEEDEEGEGSDSGDSEYENMSDEEIEPEDEEQTVGLASLLQTFAPERAGEDHEDDDALNSVAAMAESFQPKGYDLSQTKVVTKVPFLLKHTLREYQHIGLDWLVTMHEKKLNGILADEMGLGKTIQTIALLAHLACEKGNWGPHLIVVPTSVMLNWEMEFKKWCPGFKILTYYGSIKERRLKRTGWTKPNAFHVCITSYKLVIQDHGSFRRKRWKYLILDEAQNIKNFKSQRWQLLLNFATHRRLLLTGTPLQNNLMELWSLMHFLMPNVFQSHREFREWFSNPVTGMVEGNSEYNENIIRRLHKVLRPFILRRLKSQVEKQLPQKYEHVVPCRLSKRQRYLYEDFMSKTKTKETLASGNLLSVINVLMQLRKVCNHPNLFESRPVISPYQTEGLTYNIPSIIWNMFALQDLENSTRAIFRMSLADLHLSNYEADRIGELKPPGEEQFSQNCKQEESITNILSPSNSNSISTSSPSKRKHSADGEGIDENVADITEYDYILQTTVNTLPDGNIRCAPKKRRFLKWCADDYAVPAPRTKIPIPFFLMNVDPTPYLEDDNFVESVSGTKPFQLQLSNEPPLAEGKIEVIHQNKQLESPAPITKPLTEVHKPRRVGRPSKSELLKRASSSLPETEIISSRKSVDSSTISNYEIDNENEEESFQGEDESDSDDEDFSMYSAEDAASKRRAKKRKRRRTARNKREKEAKRVRMTGGTDDDEGDIILDENDDGSRMGHNNHDEEDDEEDEEIQIQHEGTRVGEVDSLDNKDENLEDNETDNEGSVVSSVDDENLVKRNKIRFAPEQSTKGLQWARAVGLNPIEFQEAEVQARSIQNRRALIERLQFINDKRCEIIPVMGSDTIEQCKILGQLPKMRYYGTRVRHLGIKYKGRSVKRDYKQNAYFNRGYEDVCSISTIKNSLDRKLKNHPLVIWRHTKALMSMIVTLDEVLETLSPIIKRFILYVPAVSSPLLSSRVVRPNPSKYLHHMTMEQELRELLRKPTQIFHPIISSMATQFPDPKLIQYDCGKLQALDSLLRKLKVGNHRVLIFTQMAKMLDILEAFLNCHGYIYLRLDGATRIDQRQLLMEKFNSDTRIFCFILSTRSGGIGVNLTGADTVIFYDSDWNPTMDAQAQDRCHRIGQTRDVHIYRLVSEKTIEENILKKSNQKRLLGELAINDGNFTTAFFAKQSIRDLFEVQQDRPDTVQRRLEAITTGKPFDPDESSEHDKTLDSTATTITSDETPMEESPVLPIVIEDLSEVKSSAEIDKNQIQLFETALAQAEDEMDVQATRTVKAEAAAELAEFDESIPLEDLGDGQEMVESSMIDLEMKSIEAELTAVERYALRFMESTIDDWSTETVAQAQREVEQQKRDWEEEQLRKAERESNLCKTMNGADLSDEDDLLTYSSSDAHNQVKKSKPGRKPKLAVVPNRGKVLPNPSSSTVTSPRPRGRPRKNPLPEQVSPTLPEQQQQQQIEESVKSEEVELMVEKAEEQQQQQEEEYASNHVHASPTRSSNQTNNNNKRENRSSYTLRGVIQPKNKYSPEFGSRSRLQRRDSTASSTTSNSTNPVSRALNFVDVTSVNEDINNISLESKVVGNKVRQRVHTAPPSSSTPISLDGNVKRKRGRPRKKFPENTVINILTIEIKEEDEEQQEEAEDSEITHQQSNNTKVNCRQKTMNIEVKSETESEEGTNNVSLPSSKKTSKKKNSLNNSNKQDLKVSCSTELPSSDNEAIPKRGRGRPPKNPNTSPHATLVRQRSITTPAGPTPSPKNSSPSQKSNGLSLRRRQNSKQNKS